MKNIQNTTEDGWDCVPNLKYACNSIKSCDDLIYEIKNCVRYTSLEHVVKGLTIKLEAALAILEDIDTSKEYKTVEIQD